MKDAQVRVSKPAVGGTGRARADRSPTAHSPQGASRAATGHIPFLKPIVKELAALTRLDNWRNFLYLGEDWGVVAVAIAGASQAAGGTWFPIAYACAVVLIGSRMRALMNLVHQASHGQLFASPLLNKWAGRLLVAWPLAISIESYRGEHQRHHRKLWDRDGDPKVSRLRRMDLIAPDSRRLPFVWKHVLLPLTLWYSPTNVAAAVCSSSERVGRLAFASVATTAAVATGTWQELLLYWVVPYVSSFQVLRYWAEMAEHSGLESDSPWTATRSWTAPWPVRWLVAPHSDHWHLAHHLYSTVPHYRLGAAHELMMRVPQYARAHHCDGLFFAHRPDAPSVIGDLMHPEAIGERRAKPTVRGPLHDLLGQH